jgi:RNA polymerase subunit RPABC4/transcription elongation factor Spt4
MLAAWPGGSWQDTVWLVVALAVAYGVVFWLSALVWVYRDAKSRTNDSVSLFVSVFLVLIFSLPGLFLYLVLRPGETLTEAYERTLETEAMLQEVERLGTCPSCRRRIEEDYLLCPYCRTNLRKPCAQCGRALSFGWVACPYCGADRVPLTAAQAAGSQPQVASSAGGSPAPARQLRASAEGGRTAARPGGRPDSPTAGRPGLPANTEPLP